MSDRLNFYFRQRVTEAELDLAFELLEMADRNLAADLGIHGVVTGAMPSPHAPVADLTIDLTAPARAYDRLGRRLFFGTGQRVDCSVDENGLPTEVAEEGQEKWLAVFLRFDRLPSDPRTDGHSREIFFRQDESFQVVVRQGPAAAEGEAERVALQPDELLLCDVHRRHGQRQILADDIDLARRQVFVFAYGDAIRLDTAGWEALQPETNTLQAALDEADSRLASHFAGDDHRHDAGHIEIAPPGFLTEATVSAALAELVGRMSSNAAPSPGAALVGAGPASGIPHSLPAGHVNGQLGLLLGWLNSHLAATTDAHEAGAISLAGADELLAATNVQNALREIAQIQGGDHFRGNEDHGGQHRTIHQPALGRGRVLLWDAQGNGVAGARLRFYADSDSVWLTLNASWSDNAWHRDSTDFPSAALRLARESFELLHDDTTAESFISWSHSWRLPMAGNPNSSFVTTGPITETGRMGVQGSNTSDHEQTVGLGGSVTFRSRFATPPSSVELFPKLVSTGWESPPQVVEIDRDGFAFFGYATAPAESSVWWFGSYTAEA